MRLPASDCPAHAASPLFVTWNVEHRGEMRLRGCIGNFEASPLGKGLHDYALIRWDLKGRRRSD